MFLKFSLKIVVFHSVTLFLIVTLLVCHSCPTPTLRVPCLPFVPLDTMYKPQLPKTGMCAYSFINERNVLQPRYAPNNNKSPTNLFNLFYKQSVPYGFTHVIYPG